MRFLRFTSIAGVLLTFLYLFGCDSSDCTIEFPENGQEFYSTLPETFTISYTNTPPKNIMINGCIVTEHFEIKDGAATCSGQVLSGFLRQGNNTFSLGPQKGGQRVVFYVDNEGPRVMITLVEGEDPITIQGEIEDPAGVSSLTVNGEFATIDENNWFTVVIPASDIYNFVAEDTGGRKAVTKYMDRSHIDDTCVRARIDESAFDDWLPILQEVVEGFDLGEMLEMVGLKTLFSKKIQIRFPKVTIVPKICTPKICDPIFGLCTPQICSPEVSAGPVNFKLLELKVSIADMNVEKLEVSEFNLASGNKSLTGPWEGVSVDVTLEDIAYGLRIKTYVLGLTDVVTTILNFLKLDKLLDALDGNFKAGLFIDRLRFAMDLGFTASNGDLDLTLANINAIGFNNFDTDASLDVNLPKAFNLFGFGLAQKVVDTITDGLEASRDLVFDIFIGNIALAIVDSILDLFINQFQIYAAAGFSSGAQISALFGIEEVHVVNNDTCLTADLSCRIAAEESSMDIGGIIIGADLGIPGLVWFDDHFLSDLAGITEDLGPAPGVAATALGFRYTSDAVDLAEVSENDLSLMVSRNLLNQGMLAIHEAGLLNFGIGINNKGVGIDLGGVIQINDDNLFVIAKTESSAPPEIVFKGEGNVVVPYLILNNYQILFQKKLEDDQWHDVLRVEITAKLPVSIHMVESDLYLQLLPPDIDVDIELFELISIPNAIDTDNYIDQIIMVKLFELMNMGLSYFALPLTLGLEYGGESVQVIAEEIYLTGHPNSHLGIDFNFNSF